MSQSDVKKYKVVVVGDSESGKTALLSVFTKGEFPESYDSTIFSSFTTEVEVENERVELCLWDTSGQAEYDHVRPLSYSDADVAVVCFDISRPDTLESVTKKWASEIKEFCAGKPSLLVGCKSDLRRDINVIAELAKNRKLLVSPAQAWATAKEIGAAAFIENSSKLMDSGIHEVFENVTLLALEKPLNKKMKMRMKRAGKGQQKNKGCIIV